jgi:hypothetical protein
VIAFKYPFMVMRDLSGSSYTGVSDLPVDLRAEVYREVRKLGNLLVKSEQRWVDHFKKRGKLAYPNPDFNPTNVIVQVRSDRMIWAIWIIDQSPVEGRPTHETSRQRGSFRIMNDREAWGL